MASAVGHSPLPAHHPFLAVRCDDVCAALLVRLDLLHSHRAGGTGRQGCDGEEQHEAGSQPAAGRRGAATLHVVDALSRF